MAKKAKGRKALETLLKVSKKVSSSLDLDKVADVILRQAKSVLDADYSALFLLEQKTKHLVLIGAKGFTQDQIKNLRILAGWAGMPESISSHAI